MWVSSWQKDLKVVFILHVQILTEDVLCESASTESVVDMDGERRRPGEIEQVVEIGASLPAESAPSPSRHQSSKLCQLVWMMSRLSSVVVEETTTRVLNLKGWLRKVSPFSPPGVLAKVPIFLIALKRAHFSSDPSCSEPCPC